MEKAFLDIKTADIKIKKKYKYFCGLVNDETRKEIGCGDLFFESPDGQNGLLYSELRKLGWRNAGYSAEYYWKVKKDDWMISYTEGDIYIKKLD